MQEPLLGSFLWHDAPRPFACARHLVGVLTALLLFVMEVAIFCSDDQVEAKVDANRLNPSDLTESVRTLVQHPR